MPEPSVLTTDEVREILCRSGRSLRVEQSPDGDVVEVRSPAGALELRVRLDEDGPVLTLSGQRIELDAADSIALRCRRFEVVATETADIRAGSARVHSDTDLELHSQGELRLRSEDELKAVANMIWLN